MNTDKPLFCKHCNRMISQKQGKTDVWWVCSGYPRSCAATAFLLNGKPHFEDDELFVKQPREMPFYLDLHGDF